MKPKTLILLAVAVGCGLVAMLGIQQAMQGGQGGGSPKVSVLVAKSDIQPGIELTDELVGFTDMPSEAVPEDAVTAPDQYVERGLTYGVVTGDIIRQSKLGKPGEFTRSQQIAPGMRVVAISVNDTQTVSGMMRPGDRVDLSVTFQIRDARGVMTTRTKTLLEYVEVFATDNRTVSDGMAKQQETKTKVVSLVVTPEQVNYIKLAESKGQLALSWRNPNDSEAVTVSDIDTELLVELSGVIPEEELARKGPRGPALYADDVAKEPGSDAAAANGFLEEAEGANPPTPAPEPVVKERPKWTVRIYQGNEPLQSEFELPAEAEPAAASPGAEGTTDANTQASLTDAFRWLHQTFTQGQLSSTKL
jgi:pilus assembly protein CpaB